MKRMFKIHVQPELSHSKDFSLIQFGTIGLPESKLVERLQSLKHPLLDIGYRASRRGNLVKLRFASPHLIEEIVQETRRLLSDVIFGENETDMAKILGELLQSRNETLAVAESCTAGKLSAWIASIPGASRYLMEGVVVYSNDSKVRRCQVSPESLIRYGAVSEEVAHQLAEGIRRNANSTWGVGITGIAGPGGGLPHKPVGTVHIAVSGPSYTSHKKYIFHGTREQITESAAARALFMLLRAATEE